MSFSKLVQKLSKKPDTKQCVKCKKTINLKTVICKYCKFSCEKQVDLFSRKFVYEHIRLDTVREKDQAFRILKNKDSLTNEYYWAPINWRPLCYSLEDLLKRISSFTGNSLTLEDSKGFLIIKCEIIDEFKMGSKREGKLQKLKVIEVCQIRK